MTNEAHGASHRKSKCKEAMIGFMLPYGLRYFLSSRPGDFFLLSINVFLNI
jgi:hypothetical protein